MHNTSSILLFACTFILGALLCSACASPPPLRATPKPMPSGVSYTGKWYSPQYENMVLEQKGNSVKGTFSYKNGGTLEGTLDGHILLFDWEQPGDFNKARRAVSGKGYFIISDDGDSIEGYWGYDDNREGGGSWDADRIEERRGPAFDVNEPVF